MRGPGLVGEKGGGMNGLIIDLFAGAGGASLGIEAALGRPIDFAVNHDAIALAVHKANHPRTRHVEEDIWRADPVQLTGGRRVAVLWASPDCTHFSVAKGGKPRSQKRRTLAGAVIKWARATQPAVIFLENVQEFKGWGPLTKAGMPDKRRMGESFRRWVRGLERLGYEVQYRTLDASLYGAPTRRRRLFIVARRDGEPIVWPAVTHGDHKKSVDLFSQRLYPLRTAGECIDWSLDCPSIFTRKRPLADATLRRIREGVWRFVINTTEPFIVGVGGRAAQAAATVISEPVGTITAKNDRAIVMPHLTKFQENSVGQDMREPMDTVMAGATRFGVVAPVMVTIDNQSSRHGCTAADAPLPTTTTENRHALLAPTLIQTGYGERDGQAPRVLSLHDPMGTIVAGAVKQALVAAFIEKGFGDRGGTVMQASPLDAPTPTLTTRDHNRLAAAHLARFNHDDHGASLTDPMPTVTAGGLHIAEVRAFLAAYYGCDKDGQPLTEPMRTVTTKDRFGLVTVRGVDYQIVDIGMRMLEPHELLAAQFGRFARTYDLSAAKTKTAKVRLIGNSVCPEVAEAIVLANVVRAAHLVAA